MIQMTKHTIYNPLDNNDRGSEIKEEDIQEIYKIQIDDEAWDVLIKYNDEYYLGTEHEELKFGNY